MKTTLNITVTGALGYSGRWIAQELIDAGHHVKTITNSLHKPNPFGNQIVIEPFNFNQPEKLTDSLKGSDVLVNTYWVRFNHNQFNHSEAVENTKILFDCAKKAGVKRIIHVSITNPSLDSELEYFKGKAELELYLSQLGIPHSIIRPAVLFGHGDILINNIAWMVRHLPIMGVFGKGDYKMQPIHVEDFAKCITTECSEEGNRTINAIGQESYTYKELVYKMMDIFNTKKPVLNTPPIIGYWLGKIVSSWKNDVTITQEEIKGLMDNLLYVDDKPIGTIRLSEWMKENKETLGVNYASELERRS